MLGPVEYKRAAIGIAAILALSSLMRLADDTTPLIPIPSHNFLAYLLVSWGYLLFLPAVFAVSYWAIRGRPVFRGVVLGIVTTVAALNAWWIAAKWTLGLDYPGRSFVHGVAFENALAFALVIGLAVTGVRSRSNVASDYAYIGLFVSLAWCAFPLFGHFDL